MLSERKPLVCKVNKKAERHLRKKHPWVFEDSITKISDNGESGDLVIVFDQKDNKLLAVGLYDAHSVIQVKLLSFGKSLSLDKEWFNLKFSTAYDLRRALESSETNAFRVIHGENDDCPGLILDKYEGDFVLKLYSDIWMPYLDWIIDSIRFLFEPVSVVLRLSRNVQKIPNLKYQEGQILLGENPEEIVFKEYGLKFYAHLIKGHKTGFFLDQRLNRHALSLYTQDKTVLDIFSYAGGFSVHALAGGASEVTSMDISEQALALARRNVALNFDNVNHHLIAGDAFVELRKLKASKSSFDVIVVDPPSLAKRASETKVAIRKYIELAELVIPIIAQHGLLVFASCSSRISQEEFFDLVTMSLRKSGRKFKEIKRSFHDVDHPIGFPEGAYLKCGYWRLD